MLNMLTSQPVDLLQDNASISYREPKGGMKALAITGLVAKECVCLPTQLLFGHCSLTLGMSGR